LGKNEVSVECLFNFYKITGSNSFGGKESDIVFSFRCRVADEKSDFGSFFFGLRLILKLYQDYIESLFETRLRKLFIVDLGKLLFISFCGTVAITHLIIFSIKTKIKEANLSKYIIK
jgi:hypothetical protein